MSRSRYLAATVLWLALSGCGSAGPTLEELQADAVGALRGGRLADAVDVAERGAQRANAEGRAVQAWEFRLLAAEAHASLFDMQAAQAVLDAAVPDDAAYDHVRARQQLLRVRMLVAHGDLAAAAAAIADAQPVAAPFPDVAIELALLHVQVLYRTGRADEADAALADLRQVPSLTKDPYRNALVLNTSGMGLATRSRYDEALRYFEQVLAQPEVEHTTLHAGALNNAAMSLARLGQFERALPLHTRAVEAQKSARRQEYMQALGEMGSTLFLTGDTARGMEAWTEALRIAAEGQLADEAILWARNLATAAIQSGDWDAAERYHAEASRWAEGNRASGTRKAYALLIAAEIAAGRLRVSDARQGYEDALAAGADVPAVQWIAHAGLARLAIAEGRPAEATRAFEAAVATVERTRSALLRADNRISFASRLITFYRGYVEFLMDQGRVERALEVADASRARVLAERQGVAPAAGRVSAAALKRLAAQTRTTLLFYWLGPERSWVWRVTGSAVTAVPLPSAAEVESLVAAHQEAIHNTLVDPLATADAPGATLWNTLVAPVAGSLAGGASVIIVPDGALHRINFETLPVSGDVPHYWIEDVTVQMAPSLAMLQRVSGPARARAGAGDAATPAMLLIGNPTPREPEFPALSYATAEMEGIQQHFPSPAVVRIEGADASPGAFSRAQPGRFPMIHFTSHAVANIESPLDSAVILSGPEQAYKLYARDVANAQLQAELVTVSACRSAGERAYAGEGLVGFAWAFLRAGSKRVVAGLWDVDDRSTATLMTEMYRRIAGGEAPAAALRAAKLELIRQGAAKPYYWGPLQVFTIVL